MAQRIGLLVVTLMQRVGKLFPQNGHRGIVEHTILALNTS